MRMSEPNFEASIYIHHLPSDTKYVSDTMYGTKDELEKIKSATIHDTDQITMNVDGEEMTFNKGVIENSVIQMKIQSCYIKTRVIFTGTVTPNLSIEELTKLKRFKNWLEEGVSVSTSEGDFIVDKVTERSRLNNFQEVLLKPWYQK